MYCAAATRHTAAKNSIRSKHTKRKSSHAHIATRTCAQRIKYNIFAAVLSGNTLTRFVYSSFFAHVCYRVQPQFLPHTTTNTSKERTSNEQQMRERAQHTQITAHQTSVPLLFRPFFLLLLFHLVLLCPLHPSMFPPSFSSVSSHRLHQCSIT